MRDLFHASPAAFVAFVFNICAVVFVMVTSCNTTPATQAIIKDASGLACKVVVQATDPKLEPLCTTAEELADVVAELQGEGQARKVIRAIHEPTQDEIYAAVKARRQ